MNNTTKILLIFTLLLAVLFYSRANVLAHDNFQFNIPGEDELTPEKPSVKPEKTEIIVEDVEKEEVITEGDEEVSETSEELKETKPSKKEAKIKTPKKPRTQLHQRVIAALLDESRTVKKKGKFEAAPFFGVMYGDILRTSYLYGIRAGFHLNERFEIEGTFGYSKVNTVRDLESIEVAYDPDMFLVGGNLVFHFPAAFLPPRRMIQNDLFLTAGGNIAHFGGQNHLGFNIGGGSKVYFTRWLVLRVDVRNFFIRFKTPTNSENTMNLVVMIGLSFFLPP